MCGVLCVGSIYPDVWADEHVREAPKHRVRGRWLGVGDVEQGRHVRTFDHDRDQIIFDDLLPLASESRWRSAWRSASEMANDLRAPPALDKGGSLPHCLELCTAENTWRQGSLKTGGCHNPKPSSPVMWLVPPSPGERSSGHAGSSNARQMDSSRSATPPTASLSSTSTSTTT